MTFDLLAASLVDSTLASTRVFWRQSLGYPDDVCSDPRPLVEVVPDDELARDLRAVAEQFSLT